MRIPFLNEKRAVKLGKSFSIQFFQDERNIASVGTKVTVWGDLGRERLATSKPFSHPGYLDISPMNDLLAVKNTAGRIALLSHPTLELIAHQKLSMASEGCCVLFSPCGQNLISGSWAGEISQRDISAGETVFSDKRQGEMIAWLSCTADRKTFLYVRQPKAVGGGAPGPSIIVIRDWPFLMNDEQIVEGDWRYVKAAALSSNARQIAVLHQLADARLRVDVVNRETGEVRSVAPFPYGGTNFSIAWSHDDRYLAYVGNREIVVLDSNTLEFVVAYEDQYPCFVGFSPTDEYLALGSWTQGTVVSTSVWRK